jgi:hypothetical protein
MKVLLFLLVAVLCWPVALLYAIVWATEVFSPAASLH